MSPALLHVRFIQFRREMQTLGWVHKGLFLLLFIAAIALFHSLFQETTTAFYVVAGLWSLAVMTQFFRPDKHFIYLHLSKPNQNNFPKKIKRVREAKVNRMNVMGSKPARNIKK